MKGEDRIFTILLTGFDPFGDEPVNPSSVAVNDIAEDELDSVKIITEEIPTAFHESSKMVFDLIDEIDPDVVLHVGQADGTADIRVERVALNLNDARIQDNEGRKPIDEKIVEEGELAFYATIPTKKIVEALKEEDIPAYLSYSAGTYVCNHVFYSTAYHVNKNDLDILYGFIHVPFLPEQASAKKKGTPSMCKENIKKALLVSIQETIDEIR